MTTFSCCLLYSASYGIVYVIIAFCIVYNDFVVSQSNEAFQALSHIEKAAYIFNDKKIVLLILLALTVFSIVWTRYIKSWKNNTRVRFQMKEDSKIDESAFILPYIFTVVTFNFDIYGWVICLLLYGSVGLLFVQSRKLQMSPIFILSRYHILTDGTNKIITRNTVESFNLKLDDQPNGIEAREIAKHVYITLEE